MSKRERESPELAAFLRRMARALVARAERGDLDALTALRETRREIQAREADAVAGLRAKGYTWAEIGAALGITKQAAEKTFGKDED
jgi:hypothetical protein